MSPKKRRPFRRPLGERRYRKLFVVAVEGSKTEPQYFAMLNVGDAVIRVECVAGNSGSAPAHVLARLKSRLRRSQLLNTDEAWLVVDKDSWTDEQLQPLFEWSQESDQYGLAVSNPKFEYWLLLHFEDVAVGSARECSDRLVKFLPEYSKDINPRKFSTSTVEEAVERARRRDSPACADWPRGLGTTVYRLVERILAAKRGLNSTTGGEAI